MTLSAFILLAIVMISSAIGVVITKNLVHSAICLITTFMMTAVLYLGLQAEFVALAQVLIYVGGVVIFTIFTILLTSHLGEESLKITNKKGVIALITSTLMVGVLIRSIYKAVSAGAIKFQSASSGSEVEITNLDEIGTRLLNTSSQGFLIPFEVISILLLAAMIGAIVIARKEGEA